MYNPLGDFGTMSNEEAEARGRESDAQLDEWNNEQVELESKIITAAVELKQLATDDGYDDEAAQAYIDAEKLIFADVATLNEIQEDWNYGFDNGQFYKRPTVRVSSDLRLIDFNGKIVKLNY